MIHPPVSFGPAPANFHAPVWAAERLWMWIGPWVSWQRRNVCCHFVSSSPRERALMGKQTVGDAPAVQTHAGRLGKNKRTTRGRDGAAVRLDTKASRRNENKPAANQHGFQSDWFIHSGQPQGLDLNALFFRATCVLLNLFLYKWSWRFRNCVCRWCAHESQVRCGSSFLK